MPAILLVVGVALPALAQDDRGWGFSGRFSGSSNSSGVVLKADPAVGYRFNQYFQTYVGLPFYFVNESSTLSTATTATNPSGFMNGIGNAYVNLRVGVENPAVNFASNLVASAPTGDKDKGFSTGRVTVDWTNSFSHKFSSITPFGNIGLANTVSDTSFFVRPFTSLGVVTHFDGGARLSLSKFADVGASAYAVRAVGQQTIISKLVRRKSIAVPVSTSNGKGNGKSQVFETTAETVGSADLANDHGFSTWLAVYPQPGVDLQIGYTRSAGYDLDTLFFGIGFHFGK